MPSIPSPLGLISLVFPLLLSPSVARAELGVIRDNGAFFSESAKSEASRRIGEIGSRFKKDVAVETSQAIPAEIKQGVNLQDRTAVSRMFEEWTLSRARQQRVNGIYILLTKEPAHLQVVVGNETQKSLFTLRDRDALVSAMLTRLRGKQNDEALQEGVNFVFAAMKSHVVSRSPGRIEAASNAPAEAPNTWGWVVAALIGFVVAWIVVGLIRSMMQGGGSAAAPGSAAGSGGFLPSLLGGMLGAAAGMWLYDQFAGHHDADQSRGTADDAAGSRGDTNYSSAGDSFSDDSGGGDFGGDSGGGDF